LADSSTSPEQRAVARQAHETLYRCLDDLDEAKREVFVLAELEQATAPEIAEALQLNLNTVYSRLRAARKAFEAALERVRAHQRRVESGVGASEGKAVKQ
jgi:RNA polymerase sigma-70 factor (ECF subfamily)